MQGLEFLSRFFRDIDILIILFSIAVLVIGPISYPNYFFINALYLASLYMIASTAWNILGGYTGLISFGHAAFFGLGAYTLALSYNNNLNPWIGVFLAGAVSAIFAGLISFPLLRLKGHWFALSTIAVGEALKLFFNNWDYVGGARGIELARKEYSIQWIYFLESQYYNYVATIFVIISLLLMYLFTRSRIGFYLQSIRESEETTMSIGINPFRYKVISMVISGFFTGLAGALYALRYRYVDPFSVMDLFISVQIALIAIIGGVYSFSGSLLSSLIVIPVAEYTRALIGGMYGARFFGIHLLVYGLILLMISLYAPGGLIEIIKKRIVRT